MMNKQDDRLDLMIKQVFAWMKKLSAKPTACPNEELLAAYLEGSLKEQEMERIEEHLVFCNECAETLISFSEVESSYDPIEETPTTEKMVKRAQDLVKPKKEIRALWETVSLRFSFFRPVPVMVFAAVVLAVVVFGIYKLHMPYGPPVELPPQAKFNIIAKIPSGIVVRGTSTGYKEIEVQDGGLLHSGDMIKIKLVLQKEAYVYLLSLDTQGNLTKLFPGKDAGLPIKLEPYKTYIFPEKAGWLRLDDNTGQETLYLLNSPEAIRNVQEKIDQLRESGMDKINKIFPGVKIQSFYFKHE